MKNSKSIKIASVLLALVLVTSCFVGGTFAKYVTSGNAGDQARVAKWGIVIDVNGEGLFKTNYDDTAVSGGVVAEVEEIVAPGTKNDTGVTFSITGKPEVDFNLDFVLTDGEDGDIVDVVVPAGEYLDWTTANDDTDTFELEDDYYPVVYTLKDSAGTVVASGNLAAIEEKLEGETATKKVEANTDVATVLGGNGTYTLTWEWAYGEYATDAGNDKADTLLGNVIAGTDTSTYVSDISTAIDFDLAISATQID